ncbi:hypothetical membrane protein [Thermoplasma acidophilum]|uniref:Hypothetical membrane protein n=1 Tax=Thermoplasma acidophilum (strain ATCC 25905 / DSM 1728 / JCM 9062 / NBRC 15155 / AMRC-C165) TaxID=273075 RepID=Q9HKL3_THEAC|nr:hypothetical protein [Thermoplasma acidophilum]CAC11724.1 hypothetical membrane protein [Thermoplasma acidophilum]
MTIRIVLDLSDDEKKIVDLIRIQGETYVDTIRRIIEDYYEYQLVKDAVNKIYEKLGLSEKKEAVSDPPENTTSKKTVEITTGHPVSMTKVEELKKNLESRWK